MKRIVFSKDICSGEPRIDGSRLSCAAVAEILHFQKLSLKDFLTAYPYIELWDIQNCLSYCAEKRCMSDKPFNFCHGCVLDLRGEDSPAEFIEDVEQLKKRSKEQSGYSFLGNLREYLATERKEKYWEISRQLKRNLFH